MRNQEIAKAMKLIGEGFLQLSKAYDEELMTERELNIVEKCIPTSNEAKEEIKEETPLKVVEPPVQEVTKEKPIKEETVEEPTTQETSTYTEEELTAKTYNEIKALAKEFGLKAVGSKKAIIENILAHLSEGSETPSQEEVDTIVEEVDTPAPVEEEDFTEIDDEDEDGFEVEVTEDDVTFYDKVVEDLEGYSDEDLADILSDIGVSPKGRRQALLSKIVQAIEEGKLEWDDSTDEEEAPKESVENNVVEEDTHEEFKGTQARRIACENLVAKIDSDYQAGNMSHKELMKYLKDFYNGKYTSQGEEADLDEYIAIQCDLIDDEGTKHDLADPYYIGDDVYCCGQHLKEVDEDLYCEICGTTYTM